MSKLLEYMQNANHPADVYIEKASDDSSADDSSSSEGSGFLSGLRNFLEHPFQGSGTVIAPNYTPRPLDDSVYSDIPGTPVASGQFGDIEDESVRDERMKESADYMAANWPRLYGTVVAADEGLANVVGGIQNAVGGGNGILTNVQRAEEGMQNYRDQWNNEYGDSYFLNPNKFATDAGSVIGSSVPIMGLSALMPGAAVAGGTRALTSALSRAGLGRLAMSKAGQALIADTVRSIPTSNLADSLSEYGTVVNDMMQNGMSEDEARRRAIPMFFKNMALDTFTVPLELGVMKGGKGIATGLLGRSAGEGMAKSIAKGAARTGMLAGASGLTEGYQEGAQNALENDVEGNRDGGWYNPFTWTKEDWEAARGGFVGGALMGVPGNVAAGFHPEARQAPLSAESQEQAQSIKDTLSHGKPAGMSNAAYNAYIELANSGNPDLIKQAASSLESFQESQGNGSSESTDDAATEAYKDYEAYDQKQEIENFLNNNTVEQIGGEDNFNWLMGVLRNGTPEEVQQAYDTVIEAEKATAEQEAKNRPVSGGGSMSPNTGNAMVNAVIQAANDSGVDPRLALAIAARESGGDDVNAISMPEPHDGIYGIMQAQDETVSELGLDSQYPDWKTDPYQNAMVGMAILKSKIANENGDVWAGVRDYNGAGEEAEQYRQLVKNNYDNMGDVGGGGNSWSAGVTGYDLPTQSDAITAQVETLKPGWKQALPAIGGILNQMGLADGAAISSGGRTTAHNADVGGAEHSYHINDDERGGGDAVDIVLPEGTTEEQAQAVLERFKETGAFKEVLFHDAGSGYHLHLGGYTGGLSSGGVSSKVTSDNGQFERELDQAAQEAKSDMDKIQAQSDQAMNEIMNDDSAEKTAQDAQQDAENAQKQAEESQQSAQDDVIPDVAQTIRDTSNNIDEINTLDDMFTKDSNGNDKFIDTPENRDFIKANYKDEITKAVNDAMSKKKAPSATLVPKNQQQTPHARLGRILSTYDRKDPKFKEYMNTFRNGTEQEQKKLADDLQTTQELERANFLKDNPLTTQQDQNIPQNAPQQAVEAPKQTKQVNTPVQEKESLETQKKRNAYLSKKQKLMERVPAGKTVKVHASTSDAGFDATYKIVPAGDITASHTTNYAVNDLYPAEYQPRDRNRPQMRGQVEKMTKGMKPELLAESQFVNEGAPVVNNSGVVLNGNGRVMAIQKAYKGLTDAHKKSAKAYKDYLVSIAPSLGIAPEKVQSMDHPVLVRQAADNADTNAIINSTEPAGSGRVHQQEAGRVQSQEKEGNEVDEKSKQSNHVNAEPQQTESKDKESTHAEEGSQGDVQAQQDVNDAALSIGGKIFQLIERRKPRRYDKKAILHYLKSVYITPYEENGAYYIDIDNFEIEKTIKVSKKDYDYAVKYTKDGKWVGSYYQRQDNKEIKKSAPKDNVQEEVSKFHDLLNSKESTPRKVVDAYKRIADAVIADAKDNPSKATAGEKIITDNRDLAINGYKLRDVFIKRRLQREITAVYDNAHKELRAITESVGKEEVKNDADIRFGTVEDAEKAVMEAFGIKPHKKPADTPAIPHKANTKATPKKAVKKAAIKDNDKIEKAFHLLDDSDEALEAEKKAILEELSHLSANPAFNPVLMYHLLKVGAIHVQRGLNEFARWAKAMKDTLPQSEPFLRSVWNSLQSMPNHANLDEKQLTAAIRYVGSLYDHGMTDKVDLRKSFIATLGVKNAKYFDAVYNAVMEYPSMEELKGANVNVSSNVSELAARSGEGAGENAMGESSIQGRTAVRGSRQDTAPAGKGPEEPGMGHDSVPGSSAATGRTAGNRRVQTQESKDSAGSTGSTELPGSVRAGLERIPDDDQRRPAELVRAAENRPQHEDPVEKAQEEQKDKHLDEVKKALPMLLPQQAEDVCIAEDRFKEHSGMMFTNGTGTGKTYTGLGIVKRFVDADKKNILIIAPSDGILKQWEEAAAKDFGITLTRLNSTKDAGEGAVTATYANVGANQALVNRDFDLVITDESHNLMGSESATPTDALQLVRAVTGHEDGFQRYHHDKHPEISSKLDKLHGEIKKLRKRDSQNDKAYNETHDPSLADESRKIRSQIEKLEEEQSKWHKKLESFKDADEKAFAEKQPSKVLFLSATPFQYVADLDYANGYLFNYSDYGPMDEQGYNRANGRETFYMENFGYKMRYNRLERPSADVDTDLMEREFNRKMVESGAMHGRMLSSAYDYDRGFIRVDAGIGKKIDEGFDWLWDQPKYSELNDFLRGRFTSQQKYYLLEAIKAKQAIPLIKEYIKEGKKVVVFHNFNKGGADNPFAISREGMDHLERLDSELADHILEQYHEFQAERPDLADLDLNDLESPIETLSKAFGDELVLYNGTLSKSEREKNKNSFNNDDSKTKIILVQSAAGQAGVSLHDTTGKHQRALINLGLPTRPSEAIQQEGRIYRVGNKSNAIFRYLNTGTYMEQTAFATKLAERAGTVENIALGEMARSLKQAYVEAFEESQEGDGWKKYLPGSKTEGTGGKANDYRQEKATDFDRAKAVYFGKQKKNSRTKSQEGHDYFATPEPIGYKMVQWLQSKPGQSLLEPSAGDGAIARWMPDNTYNTVVEPSRDLTPKLMRNVAGAKVVESTFENFDLHNKFDGIAMNPPFGHGGKTAVKHVAKAYQHLKDGGRLIAIIPDGKACQKHFDKWFYGDPEAKRKEDRGIADGVLMADIHLPSVTFDRAGTSVNTRMVVIDKYTDEGTRQIAEAEAMGRIDIAADDANELFDRIEGMDMPDEKKQASIRKAGQQLTRSKEDLKAEIKDAFPNAKEIKDEGDRMTFTMPNGSHIVVDVKNEILLTDKELAQAKKDHHIDDNGNVIVEGYAQLHGKDAYMALSQGSRENTGFHEAYHLAEGAVLTDREKAAIKKAIPDAEKRADKYAEWVEARKRGRGTAWGKLFQKIKNFAAKMRKIFTGVETVNDVFRQIESGEVWERNAKASNVAWTSVTNTAITGKTRVPIVDVSNWGRMNLTNTAKKKAIIEELKGASFKFIDSQGRFATKLDSKHFVNSSSSIQIHLKTRQKIFSNIGEILNNAIYVEKHPDVRHGKSGEYIELFSAVKDGGKIVLFRIVAKEGDKTVGRYNIGDVKFYDILQQKKDVPHHLSHSDRQNGGTSLDTVSVSDLLRNVNDRHNRPYVNSDGTLNYEFGVLKALPTNKTSYSVRKEGATNSTIDQEEAPVKPQDIIDAINDIVHIYEGSRLTDKERKEMKEASQFDPDQKQAVRPQATDLYDRHAHAGFNRMGYFNLSNYGRILALHLDNVMQLKGNLELANKVLDRQDKNAAENKMNGVNERLTPAQARQNAVMDFGAMMIRNPELARETYPAYSKIFDEGLEQHPDLKEKLDKVIQLNETYQGQTAAERAAGSIAREKEKVQLRKHPKEWLHTHFDKFYTNWVDDKHIFAKVVARAEAELGRKLAYDYDVHKQAQMAINVASSRALLFLTGGKSTEDTYKVLNKVYGHAITKSVTMKDIMDALNKVSKGDVSKTGAENAYDALGNYLIAMRTEELEKHYHDAYARSAGFDEEGTREIIHNTPESIKKIAQMYWDINTNIVNILQQQGLISKDLAGKLRKYKHYCPMYRDMSDGITDMDEMIGTIGVFNKGGGYANVSNGIKRIEGGGKRPILDPITSLSQMAVSMISKCERNNVAKTFVKLGQDFSGLGDVVVRDPTLKHADPTAFAFTVWQNGEQVVYRTTPEIYDALTNNDAQTNRFTIKMASSIAQTLRTGATISPSFIVRNLLRDTMSATVNSKTGFYLPFVDNVRGAWKLHFDKEFSAEYHASGASMSTYLRADADSSRDLTKELLGHKYDSYPVVVKQVRQLISYAWHKYEKFGNLIEDSTRAGEFRRARNQGLSIDQAGQLAREITLDFSRHGKKGQIVNKYVPFFNATIQGTDKFIRTFKDNPMRAILNTVIWIVLPSLGLWAINHDDDWYKELDENTKYTNWAIPLPGGTHLLIPKPQEVGILFGSGIEAVLNQMTGTDPHGMKEWARQYAEAMTPSLYPAVVRPLIEWMTNYSFWTGRNLVPASLQKAPSEMQFTSYTSELAKSLGDTWLAKNIKLSPIAIDNWISGWFGSAGRFIANMLNDPISYVRGNSRPSEPAKYWYEMPVIGSFIRQNGQNSEYVNRMYEIQKDMNDDYERSDAGKQRKGKKSSSNKPKELKQVDTAVSSVSKLNKEIKAIRNDPKKDPDRKRQEIDQRRTKINDLAKKVVLKFDK